MSQKHDPNQVGLPEANSLRSRPTSAREDEMAAWKKQEDEGRAICDKHNSDPNSVGHMTCGWAFKGFGFRLDLPTRVDPTDRERD